MKKLAGVGKQVLGVVLAVGALSGGVFGDEAPSAAVSLSRLRAGNARFVADPSKGIAIEPPSRTAESTRATPLAAVLSCSDSRVPPEVVFQTGLGELFVVRSGAHVTDRSVLASLEHAADTLHVPVLVVMGHQSCDLVKTALDTSGSPSRGPNWDYLLKAIQPAAGRAASLPEAQRLRGAILEHVEETINQLLDQSPVLRRQAEARKLSLVGAYYEETSGRVLFSDVVEPAVSGTAVTAGAH